MEDICIYLNFFYPGLNYYVEYLDFSWHNFWVGTYTWSTIKALGCSDVMGILMLGPLLIPNFMLSCVKSTQLCPLDRNAFTENNLLSKFWTMRTSSNISVFSVVPFEVMGIIICPIKLHNTVEPSAR